LSKVGLLGKTVGGNFKSSSNGFKEFAIAKIKGKSIAKEDIARKI
jgi:hypothetical protein